MYTNGNEQTNARPAAVNKAPTSLLNTFHLVAVMVPLGSRVFSVLMNHLCQHAPYCLVPAARFDNDPPRSTKTAPLHLFARLLVLRGFLARFRTA